MVSHIYVLLSHIHDWKLNREQRLKAIRERVEGRRTRIIAYVRERGPVTPEKIAEDLDIVRSTLSVDMVVLRGEGRLQFHLGIPGIIEIVPEKEGEI
jgi:predicted transcriptional regulator